MHDMELWIFRIFGGMVGIIGSAIVAILLDYLLKFRPGLVEKFMLKDDCDKLNKLCHRENREDHQTIFNKLDDINNHIVDIYKGIKKLNGNS